MQKLVDVVDQHRERIMKTAQYIWENPETGYREAKTAKYMEEQFLSLGYDIVRAEDIPGFYTILDTGREGPEILVLCELDSIICPAHPNADPATGAAHSCGHHAQCAAMIGIAAALKQPGALDGLCGRIRLCAVPAEELLEIEYRSQLMAEGKIRYFGGKPEFLSRGYFDGVDMALMVHTTTEKDFCCQIGSVGCIAKRIIYKGKAAHAGGSPWLGKNALYAATCGLNACNALRETFEEGDIIRFHPILTHGGDMVNAIPETAVIETYVRGKSFEAMKKINDRMNRALCGAALSLGTQIEIIDRPGYGPLENAPAMVELAEEAVHRALPHRRFYTTGGYSSGSTDMGDLSAIMPVVHPYAPGAVGTAHGNDYFIEDGELAYVESAKWQLGMLWLLLSEGGARARKIKAEYKPVFAGKEEYLAFCDALTRTGDRIVYEDGRATVQL